MPARLPAPVQLLDAIFAHTNKLGWEDRQVILRFLAGNDPLAVQFQQQQQQQQQRSPLLTTASASTAEHSRQSASTAAASPSLHARQSPSISTATSAASVSPADHGASIFDARRSQPIRQILLHEERRTETRTTGTTSAAASHQQQQTTDGSIGSSRNGGTYDTNGGEGSSVRQVRVPGGRGDNNEEPEDAATASTSQPRAYIVIDQIIFEMDYTTGCWRKLRRRIRILDRKSGSNDSTDATVASVGAAGVSDVPPAPTMPAAISTGSSARRRDDLVAARRGMSPGLVSSAQTSLLTSAFRGDEQRSPSQPAASIVPPQLIEVESSTTVSATVTSPTPLPALLDADDARRTVPVGIRSPSVSTPISFQLMRNTLSENVAPRITEANSRPATGAVDTASRLPGSASNSTIDRDTRLFSRFARGTSALQRSRLAAVAGNTTAALNTATDTRRGNNNTGRGLVAASSGAWPSSQQLADGTALLHSALIPTTDGDGTCLGSQSMWWTDGAEQMATEHCGR